MSTDRYFEAQVYQIGGVQVHRRSCLRLNECCERAKHPCGLEVLLVPKRLATTYAMVVVPFGARDGVLEVNGKKRRLPEGVAHFLEHKLFARPDGTDANEQFSALGAEANAWTDYDRTAYLFSTTEACGPALGVLLDMVVHPYFTKENVARERGIIREEIQMGEDDPWQRLHEQTMRAVYARHPLRRRICGTAASIGRITPELLYVCHRAFYRPGRMTLIVCGDVTMAELLDCVDAAYGKTPAEALPVVPRQTYREPRKTVRPYAKKPASVAQPLFQIVVKDTGIPKGGEERQYRETAMNLLSEILFSRAAPFYGDLFEQGQITPGYAYGYSTAIGAAYHAVSGEARDPDAVWKKYREVIAKAQQEGISEEDFERCRRVLYATFVSQFDYPEDIAELSCEADGNGAGPFDELLCIDRITKQEIEALLREVFAEEATVFSVLMPEDQ